jgi:hypothetical protein
MSESSRASTVGATVDQLGRQTYGRQSMGDRVWATDVWATEYGRQTYGRQSMGDRVWATEIVDDGDRSMNRLTNIIY